MNTLPNDVSPEAGASPDRIALSARRVLDGGVHLDEAVTGRLQDAARLSSAATMEVLAVASGLADRGTAYLAEVADWVAQSAGPQEALAKQIVALQAVDGQSTLDHAAAATLRSARLALSDCANLLAQLQRQAMGLAERHVAAVNDDAERLMAAGQYQDSFQQIIDRAPAALKTRAELTARLVESLCTDGEEVAQLASDATSLSEDYLRREAAHRDPLTAPPRNSGSGIDFF